MAIGYGLTGKVRGKIGSNVYRIDAGRQIISEYQPHHTEIPTEKQIETRGKMTLANAVSRLFPFTAIVGYSHNRTEARQQFVGSLFAAISGEWETAEKYVPTLDADKIVLSRGVPAVVTRADFRNSDITKTIPNATIHVPADSGVVSMLFVLLVRNKATGEYERTMQALSPNVDSMGVISVDIVVNDSRLMSDVIFDGYVVPLVPNTIAKRAVYGRLLANGEGGEFTTDVAVTLKRADILARSLYIGRIEL